MHIFSDLQFLLEQEWSELKAYAEVHDIKRNQCQKQKLQPQVNPKFLFNV